MEQSVLNTSLVARPGKVITEEISDWEPVAHRVPDITLDGRLYGGDYLPGTFGSGGVSGQWTHGGDVESGTIAAVGS